MYLKFQSNAPARTELVLADEGRSTGYRVLEGLDFGNLVRETSMSGPRGTQGARPVAGSVGNRQISVPLRVSGDDGADLARRLNALETILDELHRFGGVITWRAAKQSYKVKLRVLTGIYEIPDWGRSAEVRNRVTAVCSFSCAPYVEGESMDVSDDFAADSLRDYAIDGGSLADLEIGSGALSATANLTAEKRLIHVERGYRYGDHQATVKATPGTTISSAKFGVVLKRLDAANYVEAYVDDNGTNSRLRIDVVVDGVRTNRATTNLSARIVSSSAFWIRGRVEGSVVYAEHFTAQPTPMGSATTTRTYNLTTNPSEDALFGADAVGRPGLVFVPQHAAATLEDFEVLAYAYRNLTLPRTLELNGTIPGNAPSLAEIAVTPSGGSAAPVWAMLAWTERPADGLAAAPFGILDPNTDADVSGWATAVDAGALGGSMVKDTSVSGAESYSASWLIDPSVLAGDDFAQGEQTVEIWAVASVSSTLVSPRLVASLEPEDGAGYGAIRYSGEFGTSGRQLVVPSSGTRRRMTRLGTLSLAIDRERPRKWRLKIDGSTDSGSTGSFGLDYVIVAPARSRALNATGKVLDATFPKFVSTTSEVTKRIRSDLSAVIGSPTKYGHPDCGLGGSLLELPAAGDIDFLLKLSSLVPDDPTSDATTEQLSHSASVQFSITPRWHLLRADEDE